jgi:nitroimidazol reductase NimA-like FMN-containing flavoprotein (pyridoxamine 5'-phosphate oxidase superfamily)
VERLPQQIEELLRAALVADLTVIDERARPVTHPLIPLYDGERIFFTSSVLFPKKLELIKRNPRVSVSLSDPAGIKVEHFARATIQGDAVVEEADLHHGWERLLPLWRAKEPAIEAFVAKRVALPLFFERAVIAIEPRRAFLWRGGRTDEPPERFELGT